MKRLSFLIVALLMLGSSAFAQKSFNLFLCAGMGTIDNYDSGTAPFHNHGSTTVRNWGFNYTWNRNQIQVDGKYLTSTMTSLEGTGKALDLNFEYLYRCVNSEDNRFRFHTGAALKGYGDMRVIPGLQNANSGVSVFGDLSSVNLVEYDFAPSKDNKLYRLTAYCQLGIPIVGIVSRPGYAYVYDAQGQVGFQEIFGGFHTFAKFFPGCNTDLGMWFNLRNKNRIGLNYRWDYISSGKKDIWRFDNAYHTVNVAFMFNLK